MSDDELKNEWEDAEISRLREQLADMAADAIRGRAGPRAAILQQAAEALERLERERDEAREEATQLQEMLDATNDMLNGMVNDRDDDITTLESRCRALEGELGKAERLLLNAAYGSQDRDACLTASNEAYTLLAAQPGKIQDVTFDQIGSQEIQVIDERDIKHTHPTGGRDDV